MINTNLDIPRLAESFKIDERLKIENFLQLDSAERIHNLCRNNVPFNLLYVLDGKYKSKTPAEIANLNPVEAKEINDQITAAASKGISFLYESYLKNRIKETPANEISKELAYLHTVFDYLNSSEVITRIKQITGNQDITGAEPQFTRYSPGHFLTRHLDEVPHLERRYAFVLGITKGWHPDWGGLLQFYQKDGTPRDAWTPQFNVMSIFDIKHIHAVTYVTPYATEPRLSVTGWFHAKK